MADKEVAIKINIETEAGGKSLSALKEEFKATQKTLEGLDKSSKEYVKTLEKLGAIKDDIGDLNDEIKAFNPQGKVQAFGDVIGGLASGFQAAQGAMALFGVEGEQLQKTLLKVQAASALADGIKGVAGMGDAFKKFGLILKANPIMLIATILTGVGLALFALKDKIAVVGEAFDKMGEVINKGIQIFKDFTDQLGLTSFAVDELAEKQIKLAETVGKATEERYNKEIAIAKAAGQETIDIEIKKQAAIVASLKLQHKDYKEAQEQLLLLTIQRNTKIADENTKEAEKAAEKRKKEKDDELESIRKFNEAAAEIDREDAEKAAKLKEEDLARRKKLDMDVFKATQDAEAEALADAKQMQDDADKKTKDARDADFLLQKQALESTQALSDAFFATKLSNVAKGSKAEEDVLKKQFNLNKSFQLATAAMNGYQAIQSILAQYPKFDGGIAMAGALVATGAATLANIAKIAATKFQGGSSGGASASSLSSGSGGVAIAPPTNSSTQLNANGTIRPQATQQMPMIKAIVTETDITKAQSNIKTIEEKAKL